MDENTRFVLERIDSAKAELKIDIQELKDDVKQLNSFKERMMGRASLLGILGAGLVELILALLRH